MLKAFTRGITLFFVALAPIMGVASEPASTGTPWWHTAVVYQIYPRSFLDTNGDGIGDLDGVAAKLEYVRSLGVGAIWLNPVYPSPQIDTGYDITDYENIDPQYGTLKTFDRLVREARKQNIRVLMDMVVTLSSDKHPWFLESSSSRTNPKADWYIWADGRNGGPPNNWQSFDSSTKSAWQYVPARGQYYYHIYDRRQPALNWRSPSLRKAMFDAFRFWLNRGVAGFRLDSAAFLYVDAQLRDNMYSQPATFDEITFGEHTWNQPEYHATMRELRKLLDSYSGDRVLIGETDADSIEALRTMYGKRNDEIQLPMNFGLFWTRFSASQLRKSIGEWESNKVGGWPLLFFSNHDFPRSYSRLGDGVHNDQIAKVIAALLLTMRGTPIVYYGEELGIAQASEQEIKAGMEHSGRMLQPPFDGRDGARTPMQWTPGPQAGFTTGMPWLPVQSTYRTVNVDTESSTAGSLLRLYRDLSKIRRETPALMTGDYIPLNPSDENTLAYLRKSNSGDSAVLVVLNLSDKPQTVDVDSAQAGVRIHGLKGLLAVAADAAKDGIPLHIQLQPFGIYIADVR